MWALLSTRIRTWVLLVVAVPTLRAVIRRARTTSHQRDSDGVVTSVLGRADSLLARIDRRRHRDPRGPRRRRGAQGGWL